MITMLILKGKRDRLSSFTPEQQKAIKLQNNALTVWAVIAVIVISLSLAIGKNSPELENVGKNSLIFLGVGIMLLIAISSIISQVTIVRGRGERDDFPQGKTAINYGIMILAGLVVALLLWLAQK
jgi:membrane protein YdbS with pleckstrin-like domain